MKTALIYVLLLATMLPSISPWGTIAYYHANKDYIARVLCENRSRPELHCDGQCYLAKKLKAQQDKQDKEATKRVQNTPVFQLFLNNAVSFTFSSPVTVLQPEPLFAYALATYAVCLATLFHPPLSRG